jgi:hypothetical protein
VLVNTISWFNSIAIEKYMKQYVPPGATWRQAKRWNSVRLAKIRISICHPHT